SNSRQPEQHSPARSLAGSKDSSKNGTRRGQAGGMEKRVSVRPRSSEALKTKPWNVHRLQTALAHSSFYHSPPADALRNFLQGKTFAALMVVALLLALFLPDIWVLTGVNDNTFTDVVLTIVMAAFTFELIGLSCVDASYLGSFFQLMDIFGTISMIFDITFMAGTPANEPTNATNDGDAKKNLMLLRAARAAKVGARAGRLSRVLRILRFLPFLAGGKAKEQAKQTGIASIISGQLANLLATRVACLTIILVMVIPLFDIWTFPQTDYSLQTWVNRLSADVEDYRMADVMVELDMMGVFYSGYDYGPFKACLGSWSDASRSFTCNTLSVNASMVADWSPTDRQGPSRMASSVVVHTKTMMVQFNMHHNAQLEAAFAIATMIFIIFIMVFSGLTLSSVVTDLAVRPLERMLTTVRMIASTVFKFSAEVHDEQPEHEELTATDIDSSNEMKLLEKVVQKLAIIADLQTARRMPEQTEGMRDEDLGILSMMHGSNIVEEKERNRRKSMAHRQQKKVSQVSVRLEDFGVTQEVFHSWNFNALSLSKGQRQSFAVFTVSKFHDDGFITSPDEVAMLQRFVAAVEKEYLPVPFHSFAHAVDVVHGTSRLMRLLQTSAFLTELEEFALLIAALGHDLGHPGVNNGFLSEVSHELALQYNDRSPLENMHCAKLYTLLGKPETNVLFKLSKEQYREVRKNCIEAILHTDMMLHQGMVKDLQMIYQMNTEVFEAAENAPGDHGSNRPHEGNLSNMAEIEIFGSAETKVKVMDCILHSADVSNPCRTWEVTHAWALVCLEEFFAQGDQEKIQNLPVQFLNDRDKLNKPNSQIGFIEFMIAPFFAAQVRLWPAMAELGNNMVTNLGNWQDLWVSESNPGEEEKAKVKGRVDRVRNNMADAIARKPAA
ncbi:unnamed protein product, partial [Polarella glacialis]